MLEFSGSMILPASMRFWISCLRQMKLSIECFEVLVEFPVLVWVIVWGVFGFGGFGLGKG